MGIIAKEDSFERELMPEATHDAICCWVIDLGHRDITFRDKVKNLWQVRLVFEVPGQRIVLERDDKEVDLPRVIGQDYTVSLDSRSNLRHHLDSWRGKRFSETDLKGFDLVQLVSVPCALQIMHETSAKGKTFEKINNILPATEAGKQLKVEGNEIYFSLMDNMDIPEALPEWLVEKIKASDEWRRDGGVDAPAPDDDLPYSDNKDDDPFDPPF